MLTDSLSLSSLLAIQGLHSSNSVVQRIHILHHSPSFALFPVTFLWILGHINLPDHDTVDFAAKQSLHSTSTSDPLPTPAYGLKTYYRSLIHNTWPQFWSSQTSNSLVFKQNVTALPPPTSIEASSHLLQVFTAIKMTYRYNFSFPVLP